MDTLGKVILMFEGNNNHAFLVEGEYYHPAEFYTELLKRHGLKRMKLPCVWGEGYIAYGHDLEMRSTLVEGQWTDEEGFIPKN